MLNNLRKAFRIASLEEDTINELVTKLKKVQDESFALGQAKEQEAQTQERETDQQESETTEASSETGIHDVDFVKPDDDEDDAAYLEQVESMTVGVWVEFVGEDEQNTRCKLTAKINAIDKFIFVNRQEVKVVEKTTGGLAKELKDGTVRIISDGLLFSRALESVIGNLRDSQHVQRTGSAYQPTA